MVVAAGPAVAAVALAVEVTGLEMAAYNIIAE